MYYSKHHLTELYRRYFYGENDTTNDAIQDKKPYIENKNFVTNTTKTDIRGIIQHTNMLQDKVSPLPSDNSDIPKPFSFQVIEKIILGNYPIRNRICHNMVLTCDFQIPL